MLEEAEATPGRKPPVVQLTALLDLLFIMIFIGLLTPYEGGAGQESDKTTDEAVEKQTARMQVLEDLAVEEVTGNPGVSAGLRKLFSANMYYARQNGAPEFRETALWALDDRFGVLRFRIKLAKGIRIARTNLNQPYSNLRMATPCTPKRVTTERIYQQCGLPYGRMLTVDCNLSAPGRYRCTEELTEEGRGGGWLWAYELELISVYDNRFVAGGRQ